MVGSPGSGKSTWIETNGLKSYCICPDDLRLLVSSPTLDINGQYKIPQKDDHKVWKLLDELLEKRMSDGHFTVIDATNTRKKYLSRYKGFCEKYRYRMYVKVLNLSLEELLKRNSERSSFKKVPEDVIKLHHERLNSLIIPSSVTQIDSVYDTNEIIRLDDSNVENIWFIGDIHGCYEPFKQFIDKHYNENDLYVFVGDYTDRGPNNYEVLKTLVGINNAVFIEGNHEVWLRRWSQNKIDEIHSKDFLLSTMVELDNKCSSQDKKDISIFLRKLRLFYAVNHKGRYIYCCHGGIPTNKFDYIPAVNLIKGVGNYNDHLQVDYNWNLNTKDNEFSVHGHRNSLKTEAQTGRAFNLEDDIYDGGNLVVVKFGDDIEVLKFKSNYHYSRQEDKTITSDHPLDQLLNSKDVLKKEHDDITSFTFKRKVFRNASWNSVNCRARGLFVHVPTKKVVARSYDKFFNIGENRVSEIDTLARKFKYPVYAYKKENGFLGILSSYNNELLFCSKSSINNNHSILFETILKKEIDLKELQIYFNKNDVSLVFEVIDPIGDPHIIEYDKQECILLDVIENDWDFKYKEYDYLCWLSKLLSVNKKDLSGTFNNFSEFYKFYNNAKCVPHEGYVFRDSNNLQVKLKSDFYNRWKYLRSLKDKVHETFSTISNQVFDDESLRFLSWCNNLSPEYVRSTDIIKLRKKFYGPA